MTTATFKDLMVALDERDLHSEVYLFDGGQTVTILDRMGRVVARVTRGWSDTEDVFGAAHDALVGEDDPEVQHEGTVIK